MSVISSQVASDAARALAEDVGGGDVTAALLPPHQQVTAEIISREPMLICGQPWVNAVFHQMDETLSIKWTVAEGDYLTHPTVLCSIHGNASSIVTAERSALNFLQTLSATATQTYHYVQQLKGSQTRVLDTRKTIPGLRYAQKYAVRCAGGMNHRMGLYDAFLIKENHIKACGSVTAAVALARKSHHDLLVEIEVETLEELRDALKARPDRILLDNFSVKMLIEAVAMNQPKYCALEASGGIDLDSVAAVAATGVDFISLGALTKSIKAIDLSLLIREVGEV